MPNSRVSVHLNAVNHFNPGVLLFGGMSLQVKIKHLNFSIYSFCDSTGKIKALYIPNIEWQKVIVNNILQ